MAAKNQCKVILLSLKYNLMKEMTNRISFLTNVGFMILNNATFIIQWLILFQLKKDIGGYALNDILVLWGFSAGTYGFSHIMFQKAYSLSDLIINGKLDAFLVQPKNVLLSVITSSTNPSALGDIIYGYLIILIFRFSLVNLLLFTILSILGAFIMTAFAVLVASISFWIVRADMLAENLNNIIPLFSTYPDGIYKNAIRLFLYTVVPVGFIVYLPLHIMLEFHLLYLIAVICFTISITAFAFYIFHRGLKRYSSGNLMSTRI